MSTAKNILIFPAGTEMAFEIRSALKYSKFVRLFGANSTPCHGEMLFQNYTEGIPMVDDERFVDSINEIIDKYHIDYIYPAHDSVLLKLTQESENLRAQVITSPCETVEICRSKIKTYQHLSGEYFLPQVYNCADDVDQYPVFIKPAVGQGAQGARLIKSRTQLEEALCDDVEYVICEYLPGEEYTVDCFTDRHGVLRVVKLRDRQRIRAGIAVRSSLMPEDESIRDIAQRINRKFSFNGAWFFQVKKNIVGDYRLMEISPRIPGTMGVSRNLGINFPLLTLYNMWEKDVDILDNETELLLDRAFISRFSTNLTYQTVYVDFDDTIVVNGQINTVLMMFLYQAVNQGKKLFLLTKHARDIEKTLAEYRISAGLFEGIIHIPEEGNKADCIFDSNSIFIDDSFAERKSVREACGIPVFDLDMVESLLDWRM